MYDFLYYSTFSYRFHDFQESCQRQRVVSSDLCMYCTLLPNPLLRIVCTYVPSSKLNFSLRSTSVRSIYRVQFIPLAPKGVVPIQGYFFLSVLGVACAFGGKGGVGGVLEGATKKNPQKKRNAYVMLCTEYWVSVLLPDDEAKVGNRK